jgi:predicted GNAT family N-acyltransferase
MYEYSLMNQFQTNIRLYNPSDRNACMMAFRSNVPKYFTLEEINDFEHFLNQLENPEESDKTLYYVLELENRIIGCGGFSLKEKVDAVTFSWGMVHQAYHKKGLGEELLRFRIREIKTRFPGKQIILDTTQFSYTFFERYGFKTVKVTDNFYATGMHRYDMVLED